MSTPRIVYRAFAALFSVKSRSVAVWATGPLLILAGAALVAHPWLGFVLVVPGVLGLGVLQYYAERGESA